MGHITNSPNHATFHTSEDNFEKAIQNIERSLERIDNKQTDPQLGQILHRVRWILFEGLMMGFNMMGLDQAVYLKSPFRLIFHLLAIFWLTLMIAGNYVTIRNKLLRK